MVLGKFADALRRSWRFVTTKLHAAHLLIVGSQVEYLAFIREHHVDRFSAFDTFLKMLSIEPYIINEVGSHTLIWFVHRILTFAVSVRTL